LKKFFITGINYPLSLYYSYLLPLFRIDKLGGRALEFTKVYGECRGLKCLYKDSTLECYVPSSCSEESLQGLLGIKLKPIIDKLLHKLSLKKRVKVLKEFTLVFSPKDRAYVFTSIYLSRNTDYYANTVKWMKSVIANKCLDTPTRCLGLYKSYQYREYLKAIPALKTIIYKNKSALDEAAELMGIRGFGVKSAMAYLLHAYGMTHYAPIDRHYERILTRIGISGKKPSKSQCIKARLRCVDCLFSQECIYGIASKRLGRFNGVLQSIGYTYSRVHEVVSGRIKPRHFEEEILFGIDIELLVLEAEELFEEIRERLRWSIQL